MSMISTLLATLPSQKPRIIKPMTQGQIEQNDRNRTTYLANIERVFEAIKEGHRTINQLVAETTLAKTTVLKAVQALEIWEDGPRIIRTKGPTHYFKVAK